jgi:hypothetical protein
MASLHLYFDEMIHTRSRNPYQYFSHTTSAAHKTISPCSIDICSRPDSGLGQTRMTFTFRLSESTLLSRKASSLAKRYDSMQDYLLCSAAVFDTSTWPNANYVSLVSQVEGIQASGLSVGALVSDSEVIRTNTNPNPCQPCCALKPANQHLRWLVKFPLLEKQTTDARLLRF